VAVCIRNWINKRKYTFALNFIYSFIHVVALGFGMFVFVWGNLFVGICILL